MAVKIDDDCLETFAVLVPSSSEYSLIKIALDLTKHNECLNKLQFLKKMKSGNLTKATTQTFPAEVF